MALSLAAPPPPAGTDESDDSGLQVSMMTTVVASVGLVTSALCLFACCLVAARRYRALWQHEMHAGSTSGQTAAGNDGDDLYADRRDAAADERTERRAHQATAQRSLQQYHAAMRKKLADPSSDIRQLAHDPAYEAARAQRLSAESSLLEAVRRLEMRSKHVADEVVGTARALLRMQKIKAVVQRGNQVQRVQRSDAECQIDLEAGSSRGRCESAVQVDATPASTGTGVAREELAQELETAYAQMAQLRGRLDAVEQYSLTSTPRATPPARSPLVSPLATRAEQQLAKELESSHAQVARLEAQLKVQTDATDKSSSAQQDHLQELELTRKEIARLEKELTERPKQSAAPPAPVASAATNALRSARELEQARETIARLEAERVAVRQRMTAADVVGAASAQATSAELDLARKEISRLEQMVAKRSPSAPIPAPVPVPAQLTAPPGARDTTVTLGKELEQARATIARLEAERVAARAKMSSQATSAELELARKEISRLEQMAERVAARDKMTSQATSAELELARKEISRLEQMVAKRSPSAPIPAPVPVPAQLTAPPGARDTTVTLGKELEQARATIARLEAERVAARAKMTSPTSSANDQAGGAGLEDAGKQISKLQWTAAETATTVSFAPTPVSGDCGESAGDQAREQDGGLQRPPLKRGATQRIVRTTGAQKPAAPFASPRGNRSYGVPRIATNTTSAGLDDSPFRYVRPSPTNKSPLSRTAKPSPPGGGTEY